jgi:hypothetical protein
MTKLSLELDALVVESFATTGTRAPRAGTVRAHSDEVAEPGVEATPIPVTQQWTCTCPAGVQTDLCSLGCSDGCSVNTCPTGSRACCV